MFKVAIIGTDSVNDKLFCCKKCLKILSAKNEAGESIQINSVGDKFIDEFTQFYELDCQYFLANFDLYKKEAFNVRNKALLENTDAFIIFMNGEKPNKDVTILKDLIISTGKPYRLLTH